MARVKRPRPPLPPRDGLGPSRVRHPGPEPVFAIELLSAVILGQRRRHPADDEAAILRRFAQGQVVLADATPLTPASTIHPGTDVFFYRRPAPEPPVPYEIASVYEDDAILVINKPPFLATMPRGAHITETATVRLRRATGNEELTPAHRLDRQTSGLLLFTKRREVRGAYQELFAAREVHKQYVAIAPYLPRCLPATWRSHIEKLHGEIASREVPGATPNATTILRSVSRLAPSDEARLQAAHAAQGPLAKYLLEPVTGRTHQLRVHMNANAAPILGDAFFPRVLPEEDEDYCVPLRLTSVRLAFTDPLSGEERHFEVEPWI